MTTYAPPPVLAPDQTPVNASRIAEGKASIVFGIGLHTGKVMLGVKGDDDRNDAIVHSDAVNLAAR